MSLRGLSPSRHDYSFVTRTSARVDVAAGLSVAIVALPLALAFGVSSGVGAQAGLVTAILAGALAAVFGGSHLQVSGPTGAMTVVLIPIYAQFGANAVFAVGIVAGIILVVASLAGAAHSMRYIPLSVIEGFTLGIALLIGMQQVPLALGMKSDSSSVVMSAVHAIRDSRTSLHAQSLAISLGTVLFIVIARKIHASLPAGIIAVVLATLATSVLHLDVKVVGTIPRSLSWVGFPSLSDLPWTSLFIPALSVAGLAAIEGLLCASVADSMADVPAHNPHRELLGQGIANLIVPLFGGVPATAAIARTAVNVKAGATSRIAAITHSLILLVCVLAAAGLVSHIPLASLAGVLLATAARMIDVPRLKEFVTRTTHHGITITLTALATLFLDLVEAVALGLVVAAMLSFLQSPRQHHQHEAEIGKAEDVLHDTFHEDGP
ncbi:MAG: SulP family inorganic anion transporter [Actinomycetes bacterium]